MYLVVWGGVLRLLQLTICRFSGKLHGRDANQETGRRNLARMSVMKRIDRVMYAFFLLALLADVARAHACMPVGGDVSDSAMLSAASQLRVSPAGEAALLPRRTKAGARSGAKAALPSMAKFRSYAARISGWARVLSNGSSASDLVALAASAAAPSAELGVSTGPPAYPASVSSGIFEHSGRPAP